MTDCGVQGAKPSLRLQKLIEANQKLAQVESVKDLIPLFLTLAIDVTSAASSSFLVFDPRKQALHFSDVKGQDGNTSSEIIMKQSIEIPIGVGIAGWIAKERQPLIVNDVMKDKRFLDAVDKSTGFVTRSILGVPVVYGDELLGMIEVLNPVEKPNFEEADKGLPAAIKKDGGTIKHLIARRGPALGIYQVADFKKEVVVLRPGESILFATDNVSETLKNRFLAPKINRKRKTHD